MFPSRRGNIINLYPMAHPCNSKEEETMPLTVGAVSLGCNKNRVDTESALGLLRDHGYRITGDPSRADIILVNTCGFIGPAKEESINTILEMAEYKKTGRCRLLVVSGCLAQRYEEELLKELRPALKKPSPAKGFIPAPMI